MAGLRDRPEIPKWVWGGKCLTKCGAAPSEGTESRRQIRGTAAESSDHITPKGKLEPRQSPGFRRSSSFPISVFPAPAELPLCRRCLSQAAAPGLCTSHQSPQPASRPEEAVWSAFDLLSSDAVSSPLRSSPPEAESLHVPLSSCRAVSSHLPPTAAILAACLCSSSPAGSALTAGQDGP